MGVDPRWGAAQSTGRLTGDLSPAQQLPRTLPPWLSASSLPSSKVSNARHTAARIRKKQPAHVRRFQHAAAAVRAGRCAYNGRATGKDATPDGIQRPQQHQPHRRRAAEPSDQDQEMSCAEWATNRQPPSPNNSKSPSRTSTPLACRPLTAKTSWSPGTWSSRASNPRRRALPKGARQRRYPA